MRSKAHFKLMRETMGLSTSDVAEMYFVNERSVRRWEDASATDNNIPEAVYDSMLRKFDGFVNEATNYAAGIEDLVDMRDAHNKPVALAYYRSQEELDNRVGSLNGRLYNEVNACTRLAAVMLTEDGFRVEGAYVDEYDEALPPRRFSKSMYSPRVN